MAGPTKPSEIMYTILVTSFFTYAICVGYFAGTRPHGEWRYFSWHPFLMTCGLIGCTGIAAVTKKLGGYANTKTHGLLANLGLALTLGGFYVIYQNKNNNGASHFTSNHGKAGLACILCAIGAGMAGGVFLHPDFGIDITNKQIRLVHKTFARVVLACAWMTAFMGMMTLTSDTLSLAIMGVPLLCLAPFTLL